MKDFNRAIGRMEYNFFESKSNLEQMTKLVKDSNNELANSKLDFYFDSDVDEILVKSEGTFIKHAKRGDNEFLEFKENFNKFAGNLKEFGQNSLKNLRNRKIKGEIEDRNERINELIDHCYKAERKYGKVNSSEQEH